MAEAESHNHLGWKRPLRPSSPKAASGKQLISDVSVASCDLFSNIGGAGQRVHTTTSTPHRSSAKYSHGFKLNYKLMSY